MTFTCPQCKQDFTEEDGVEPCECLVGGHWTPHSSTDVPYNEFARCCHQFQTRVGTDVHSQ